VVYRRTAIAKEEIDWPPKMDKTTDFRWDFLSTQKWL